MHYWTVRVLAICFGFVAVFTWPQAIQAESNGLYVPQLNVPQLNGSTPPICRVGVNGSIRDYPVQPLRLGWYLDYQATLSPPTSPGTTYYPMIRLEQIGESYSYSVFGDRRPTTPSQLNAVIAAHPGAYWFIGNEPDRIQFQDDLAPHVYALAYRDLYQIIKQQDPSAKIVAGSIVQPTPVRLEYLDLILKSYYQLTGEAMPVDVWAFHNFILNEASCAVYPAEECWGAEIPRGVNKTAGLRVGVEQNANAAVFKQQVIAFRKWVADRGYRNTPVFLSEFGVLMPKGWFFEEGKPQGPDTDYFSEARVNAFMTETINFLLTARDPNTGYPGDDNRLVQRFSWYSVDDSIDHNGYLFDRSQSPAQARTVMGDNFAQIVANIPMEHDFIATHVRLVSPPPLTSQGPVDLTLEATVANSGNSVTPTSAVIRFYNGDPAQGGVQIGTDQPITLPGCGERATVTMLWPAVPPGNYQIFAQVIANVNETTTTNNRVSTAVRFFNDQVRVPNIRRGPTFP